MAGTDWNDTLDGITAAQLADAVAEVYAGDPTAQESVLTHLIALVRANDSILDRILEDE